MPKKPTPFQLSEAQRADLAKLQQRECKIERSAAPPDDASVPIAFSTEAEVNRGWYIEILDHGPGAVVLPASGGMGFLDSHDRSALVGRAENVRVDKDRVGRADVRFSSAEAAQQIRKDMLDGIRPDISVGYLIHDYIEEQRDGQLYIRATKWEPKEASTVSVPADYKAGVNRGDPNPLPSPPTTPTTERNPNPASTATQEGVMTPEELAALAAKERAALDAKAAETRDSASKIMQIAEANKIPMADARKAVEENWSTERFLELALAQVRKGTPGPLPDIDGASAESIAGAQDAKRYSYARAIMAASDIKAGRTPERSLEVELSEALAKKTPAAYAARGGILIPMRTMNKRDGLDSITATKGTELKQNMPAGELIEMLYNVSVLNQMGMTVLTGLTGPIPFPKETGLPTHYWQGENPGAAAAKSAPSYGTVSLNPKTLIGTVPFSRQLVVLGNPSVEALVRKGLAKGSALALDKAGIYGIGAGGQPMGIYSAPDVNAKAMGGAVAFGELVDMATACASDNALLGSLGFITTPGMAGKLMQTLVASAAGSAMIWQGTHNEGVVAGYKAISSNQLSSLMSGSAETGGTEHGIVFGDFSSLVYGSWGIQELIVDNVTRKGEAMIEVTSFEMADVLLRHGESFCKSTGATLA